MDRFKIMDYSKINGVFTPRATSSVTFYNACFSIQLNDKVQRVNNLR